MLASAQMMGCADEGGACGAGEVQALAFQRLGASPSVSTVQDWWLVNPATGPRYAISRCGDEVITLPKEHRGDRRAHRGSHRGPGGRRGMEYLFIGPVTPLETGFLVCQALANSTENLRFSFDPATGALIPRQDGKPARPTWPGRQSGDQGYYPVGDGRFLTGQSLPGYPMRDPNSATSSEVDYRQMYLIDSEVEIRVALMKMLVTDVMFISLELDAVGFTDATRGGFYVHPLPKR